MTLPELVAHIVEYHHRRIETMLDQLRPETVRWAKSTPASGLTLTLFAREFVAFANRVRDHFAREQVNGFGPLLKLAGADANPPSGMPRSTISDPLTVLFLDHDNVFDTFRHILELVGKSSSREPPGELGVQVLAGLADLRVELNQMMHEENNLLFALGLGIERARAMGRGLPTSPSDLDDRGLFETFTELRAYRVSGGRLEQ